MGSGSTLSHHYPQDMCILEGCKFSSFRYVSAREMPGTLSGVLENRECYRDYLIDVGIREG
jgi:hypothetical protein